MTDLGLAPGLVNIMAERELLNCPPGRRVENLYMYVGGIPVSPNINPLKYSLNWSIEGLINEYLDDCLVLRNSYISTKPGMSELEIIETKEMGRYEAFNTSGGIAHTLEHMKERGLYNCQYKTLRHIGHWDVVNFLLKESDLDINGLRSIFTATKNFKDMVIIVLKTGTISTKSVFASDYREHTEELCYFAQDGMTAMQVATAAPVAVVASMLLQGMIRVKDRPLRYDDIPCDQFFEMLAKILK